MSVWLGKLLRVEFRFRAETRCREGGKAKYKFDG